MVALLCISISLETRLENHLYSSTSRDRKSIRSLLEIIKSSVPQIDVATSSDRQFDAYQILAEYMK